MNRDATRTKAARWAPGTLERGAHLFVLWGFAILQPVLDVIPAKGEFFVAREVGGWSLAAFVVLFAVVPPALLLAVELLAGRLSERLARALHLGFIGTLGALGVLYPPQERLFEAAAQHSTEGWILVAGAVGLGAIGTLAYARVQLVRGFLTVLTPAPVVFVLLFIFTTPAWDAIAPGAASVVDAPPSRTPVVVLVVDELPLNSILERDRRVDAARFPNFARLAERSTWYPNMTTSGDFTIRVLPSLLTGRLPAADTSPIFADHPDNLFTLLAASHRVNSLEYATGLCPDSICRPPRSRLRRAMALPSALSAAFLKIVVPAGTGLESPELGLTWREWARAKDPRRKVDPDGLSKAEALRAAREHFEGYLPSIQPADPAARAPFHFLHTVLPHTKWKYLPSGKLYAGEFDDRVGGGTGGVWPDDSSVTEHGWQRHLLQVKYTDRMLGRLVRRLTETGLYDRSLLVVVADHGVSFQPGEPRRAVNKANAADVGSVPLFIKAPGQRTGRVSDTYLQTIDLLPTIAELLGRRVPWKVDGRPLSRLGREGRSRLVISGGAAGTRVVTSPRALESQRARSLRRQHAIFGSGREGRDLFEIGPARGLLGEQVSKLRSAATGNRRVSLDGAADYASVDPGSRYLPALVTGRIHGDGARAGRAVAVAVNGRVEATGRTYAPAAGDVRVAMMVPPRSLHRGRNRIEIFELVRRGSRLSLLPLGDSD